MIAGDDETSYVRQNFWILHGEKRRDSGHICVEPFRRWAWHMSTRCDIAGFNIRRTTTDIMIRFLNGRLRYRRQTIVFFANSNFVTVCRHLQQKISNNPDILLLNDGFALDIVAFLRFGTSFPENMNGTDFTWALLSRLDQKAQVYLLGGRPRVVETAAEVFDGLSRVKIVGHTDGYSLWDNEADVIENIRHTNTDILLVALGNPLQEEWILDNRDAINVPLIISVGALFDFVSGHTPRAPKVLRIVRLEWAHRLALEPRRLIGRYTIGIARFLATALFRGD